MLFRGCFRWLWQTLLGGKLLTLLTSQCQAPEARISGDFFFFGGGKLDRLFQVGPPQKMYNHIRYNIYICILYILYIYIFFFCLLFLPVYVLKPARCFSVNSFSYKGSYFKFRGEGSQIFWICFGGAAGQGAVWWSSWCNNRFLIYVHPAPKFVREYETNILAHNPSACIIHPVQLTLCIVI